VGDDLRVVPANRQVCPAISEITFGDLHKQAALNEENPQQLPDDAPRY